MKRRTFLGQAGALALSAASACRVAPGRSWKDLRLVHEPEAIGLERAVLDDAAQLLRRAASGAVPVVSRSGRLEAADVHVRPFDGVLGPPRGGASKAPSAGGAFLWQRVGDEALTIAGQDPEGIRNGLYAWLESLGFAFFRDGEQVPRLDGPMPAFAPFASQPAFSWRGDMIWDNYLGPRRHCAAVWDEGDWERALLFMARSRMNFLEFYPPLERVMASVFPEARGLDDGVLWKSDYKHDLARRVLARGRALGIRFMYVLSYGAFPSQVQALYPRLAWRSGFLCAHQPELRAFTERVWRALVEQLGTDHLYAIRHRGEEGQSYSDPCRSVSKAEGYLQAFDVLQRVDSLAMPTVWTWGERVPELFSTFPATVRAVHVRHGMGGVFAERGSGREQPDGAPPVPAERRWLSAQFTVFGGNETGVQTPWSAADALVRDARASRASASCDGYFQWPEWSDTSPWVSWLIGRISWDPDGVASGEQELRAYAQRRHGSLAAGFLAAALPIARDGNGRLTSTPRKRLLVPYFLERPPLDVLAQVRAGLVTMASAGPSSAWSPFYERDLLDLASWSGVRQAHTFEAAAWAAHQSGDTARAAAAIQQAGDTWTALGELLGLDAANRSMVEAARHAGQAAAPSSRAVDSFWSLGCDFYGGYPLVLGPEAIELVYLPQCQALGRLLESSAAVHLPAPGWFWHDFPEARAADEVRALPREDAGAFERVMRARLTDALASGRAAPRPASTYDTPLTLESRAARILGLIRRQAQVPLPTATLRS